MKFLVTWYNWLEGVSSYFFPIIHLLEQVPCCETVVVYFQH